LLQTPERIICATPLSRTGIPCNKPGSLRLHKRLSRSPRHKMARVALAAYLSYRQHRHLVNYFTQVFCVEVVFGLGDVFRPDAFFL